MSKLLVVIVSTRTGRKGLPVGKWFIERARAHGKFEVDVADLKEIDLPLLDEPEHPRLGKYQYEHTKQWSAKVSPADAFVFVTPEYNHGASPSLINALDYLAKEWAYKPAAFVSYGGLSGGTRGVVMAKSVMTTARMMPIPDAINLPFIDQHFGEDGAFHPPEKAEAAVGPLLDELKRWSDALATMRR
jgi:NAD(P)H-dependent FMN reductase